MAALKLACFLKCTRAGNVKKILLYWFLLFGNFNFVINA